MSADLRIYWIPRPVVQRGLSHCAGCRPAAHSSRDLSTSLATRRVAGQSSDFDVGLNPRTPLRSFEPRLPTRKLKPRAAAVHMLSNFHFLFAFNSDIANCKMFAATSRQIARSALRQQCCAFSSTRSVGAAAEVKKLGVIGAGQMVSTRSFGVEHMLTIAGSRHSSCSSTKGESARQPDR